MNRASSASVIRILPSPLGFETGGKWVGSNKPLEIYPYTVRLLTLSLCAISFTVKSLPISFAILISIVSIGFVSLLYNITQKCTICKFDAKFSYKKKPSYTYQGILAKLH